MLGAQREGSGLAIIRREKTTTLSELAERSLDRAASICSVRALADISPPRTPKALAAINNVGMRVTVPRDDPLSVFHENMPANFCAASHNPQS